MLVIMLLFWLVTALINIPTWFLGLLVAPVMSRGTWLIEFLYPLPIARWGHLLILRWSQPKVPLEDKAANYHSRTLEQRVEVVKGRIFIHPIPQLLDNLGYLVVCLPPNRPTPKKTTAGAGDTPLGKASVVTQYQPDVDKVPKGPIVAFLVDCGDADTVAEQTQLIRETHYPNHPSIRIQMVLSTHKHHDHTAGNVPLKRHPQFGPGLEHIVGGTVERVPGCTFGVADGDLLRLPALGNNDMNELAYVEVVSVPAHTRGSVVYMLRSTAKPLDVDIPIPPACFAFTGDTMFCGGGGVPFEAGGDPEIDQGGYKDNAHGAIRAGVGSHAVERCFAEILVRGTMANNASFPLADPEGVQNQLLIFAGHEYTAELLGRQFSGGPAAGNDANKWKNFPPHVFFETVSELYVAMHRRSLPQATGKVLAAAPTTLRKELSINPHLRSLARRAELVVQAIRLWDAYFCRPKAPKDEETAVMRVRKESVQKPRDVLSVSTVTGVTFRKRKVNKTPATETTWNMAAADAAKSVFTTVYTADLDNMIQTLAHGDLTPDEAATMLEGMKLKLREPVIRRRPIPGALPSERVVFKGLIGFALLGSRPSAMTLSDSTAMKMPQPIVKDMSCILVSKKRLIAVLGHLGFLQDDADGHSLIGMIDALWQEAHDYSNGLSSEVTTTGSNDSNYNTVGKSDEEEASNGLDKPDSEFVHDTVQLGTLKWILYGFPAKQPSWFSSYCMPCGGMTEAEKELEERQDAQAQQDHPVKTSRMKRRHGELVRHDVMTCKLCLTATGKCTLEDEYVPVKHYVSESPSETDDLRSLPLPTCINAKVKPGNRTRSDMAVRPEKSGRARNLDPDYPQNYSVSAGYSMEEDSSVTASYVESVMDSAVEVSAYDCTSLLARDMQAVESTEENLLI